MGCTPCCGGSRPNSVGTGPIRARRRRRSGCRRSALPARPRGGSGRLLYQRIAPPGKQCRQVRQSTGAHERAYRGGVGDLIDNPLGDFDFVRAADQDDFDIVAAIKKVDQRGVIGPAATAGSACRRRDARRRTAARARRAAAAGVAWARSRQSAGAARATASTRRSRSSPTWARLRVDGRVVLPLDRDIEPGNWPRWSNPAR